MHEPRRFEYIDALRGLAILAVILVHSHIAVPPATPWLATMMAGGARGVQLFYVASAITLCLSWDARAAHERAPVRNFYLRRLFRIVPMFYCAIAGYVILYGFSPRYYAPNGIDWHYVPLTALFLNGFHPEMVTSVVPGGWSIVVEMTFYLLLPFLVTRFRALSSLVALFVVSLLLDRVVGRLLRMVYLSSYPPEQAYLVDALTFLNFWGQFPVFVLGLLAYAVLKGHQSRRLVLFGVVLMVVWLAIAPSVVNGGLARVFTMHVPIGAVFATLALALAWYPVRLVVNPAMIWMGKLSFSMYLTHFAVLDGFAALGVSRRFGSGDAAAIVHYLAAVLVTAAVSSISYRFIERPGIDAGRRLIERFERRAQPPTAAETAPL